MKVSIALRSAPSGRPPARPRLVLPRAKESFDLGYEPDVVIVGGGLAGLACARTLVDNSLTCALFESSNRVGGRVKTDKYEGFQLDYGFQIFLTAYPEAQRFLNYEALRLKPFYNGAMVWYDGNFYRVADPFRHPIAGIASVTNPIGSFEDKARVGLLRWTLAGRSDEEILSSEETTTMERLKELSFSSSMIDRFFRPFFGGIFFDNDLQNTLPEKGIGEIAMQLANSLPPRTIQLNRKVEAVHPAADIHVLPSAHLSEEEVSISAKRAVVVAVDGPSATHILDPSLLAASPSKDSKGVGTCCLYFSALKAPTNGENVLYLNGEMNGIVNNCCFPSTVSSSYAPPGETLVSVSTVGTFPNLTDDALETEVRKQMGKWFGPFDVSSWKLLKIHRIPYAQPNQSPPTNLKRPVRLGNKLYICGDHRDTATFDGALKSGRRAAEAILQDL